MKKVGVLFSAGVESSSLLVYYLEKGYITLPLYARCGLPWEKAELKWSERLWASLKRRYSRLLPLRVFSENGLQPHRGDVEIPLRNLTLVMGAVVRAYDRGVRRLAVGSLGIYPFPDNNREYFQRLENLISEGLRENVRLETPFMGMEKWEVIREFHGRISYKLTFSCMKPVRGKHCGICEKCLERKEGFSKAGVPDPTNYAFS